MPDITEKADRLSLPLVVTRGIVVFPSIPVSFEISDECFGSSSAAEYAAGCSSFVFLVSLDDISEEPSGEPDKSKLSSVGTVAKIKQLVKTPEGKIRIIADGFTRALLSDITKVKDYTLADVICKAVVLHGNGGIKGEAFIRETVAGVENIVKYLPSVTKEIVFAASSIKNPGLLADFVAANILVKYEDKLAVLECFDPMDRIELLNVILSSEADLLNCEAGIHKKVRDRLNRNQRDYYLREQIKAIEEELGEGGGTDEFATRISEAHLPEEVEKKLLKENDKLSKSPFGSAEATVIANYLDVCLGLPWNKVSRDRVDIASAAKILDADHDGLSNVKERILEFLAVKQLTPDIKNQIICLVGSPGVGKTSVAASIARAMKRKYVRVSLGGVRDEADIRGHRKTYVGAMPGRIINALSQAGTKNPLILLDEIDKLTSDAHGDPTSALLEVLDPEQNKSFRDHFVEMPFDLSDCLFIATANSLENVPRPLIDRMEIIELQTYTKSEKLSIAKNHLIAKQFKRHGLDRRRVKITDNALNEIIDYYTREAGVRNLERNIASIARKCAMKIVRDGAAKITVDASDIHGFLGPRKLLPDHIEDEDCMGTVNGLAWTEVGGDMLRIEVAVLDGTGKLELTGSLGDVMKESAKAALTYVRSIASEYGISPDFYQKKDIHIHVPEGAVPKDGPSAGVTMMTALLSALSGIPVRRDVAMTGEITLRGKVLPIGGLKEKTMAAYSAGITTVLIPDANTPDLEKIDPMAREHLVFVPCRCAKDVLSVALAVNNTVDIKENKTGTVQNKELPEIIPTITGTVLHAGADKND